MSKVGTLVGKKVPNFTANAVMADNDIQQLNLKEYLNGSYGWIFFWPLDFTFVCPSEIIAHDHRMKQFEEKGVKVVGISIDSQYTHLAWKNTSQDEGGLGQVQFPMVADIRGKIAKKFGILSGGGVAFRASFLVDQNGVVRHAMVNDLPLGRNVDEALRLIDALQFTEEHGEVCPAGWQAGDEGMKGTPEGVKEYLAKNAGKL